MIKNLGHAGTHRRVALNVGSGFVPGFNSVLMGAALAGGKLGWEMVGIRDGFEGLLHPERYADGGIVALSPERGREPRSRNCGRPRPGAPGGSVPLSRSGRSGCRPVR